MSRNFRSLIAAAALLASSAHALATTRDFKGYVCVLSATATCQPLDIYKDDCFPSRFSPPNYGGNTNNTSITAFGEHQTMNFRYPSGSIVGTAWRYMTQTVIGGNIAQATVRGRIIGQSPANPNASVITNVIGDIVGINGNCNIRFRFTGQSALVGAGSVLGGADDAGLKNGGSGY